MKERSAASMGRMQRLLRALRHRNYRLFFIGQSVSLVGTWMQQVAMSWLAYRLTGSAALLGVIGFAGQLPTFLLAPFAGVLADRWDRRRLVLLTQTFAMVQAVALATFVYTGTIKVWLLVFLSSLLGIVAGFDIPVRQSFVVELVPDKEDLGNAIALNSSMVNGARLIGPSLAGVLVATVGEGPCFALNALSYLAVIIAIASMRLAPAARRGGQRQILHELREGVAYALRFTPIRDILLLICVISLMGMPYSVLMPVFAKDILHGGAHTFGFLVAASGLGAFISTIFLASRTSVLGLGRIMYLCAGVFGVGIAGFALSRVTALSLAFLCIAGFGAMAVIASGNTILQTVVEDDKRGRVMSFYTMAFMGTTPFGSLVAGMMAQHLGATPTLLTGAAACLIGGVLFARNLPALRDKVRPIYRELGIIPEVAAGVHAASVLTSPPEKR